MGPPIDAPKMEVARIQLLSWTLGNNVHGAMFLLFADFALVVFRVDVAATVVVGEQERRAQTVFAPCHPWLAPKDGKNG